MKLDAFLDANVIADWILIKNFTNVKTLRNVDRRRVKKTLSSFKLIQNILEKYHSYVHFGTSALALREAIYVVYENYKLMKLYEEGVPFKYWNYFVHEITLTENEAFKIREIVLKEIDQLFEEDKIKLYDDSLDLNVFPYLILQLGMRTHDAILVSTAIINNFYYYITRDERLCLKNKQLTNKFNFKIIAPTKYLKIIDAELK